VAPMVVSSTAPCRQRRLCQRRSLLRITDAGRSQIACGVGASADVVTRIPGPLGGGSVRQAATAHPR
jgi:hypothetical protein